MAIQTDLGKFGGATHGGYTKSGSKSGVFSKATFHFWTWTSFRNLPRVVFALLACQIVGQGISPGDALGAGITLTAVAVADEGEAAPRADVPLPRVSFATRDGLFSILPTGASRRALMTGDENLFFNLDWSADGNLVAVERNYGDVYITQVEQTTPTSVFESDCFRPPMLDLAWQQDGETLVIKQLCDPPVSGASGSLDVFLARPTGQLSSLAQLPDNLQSDLYISPDATQVAYVADQHIYTLGTDGTPPQQVTQTAGVYGAAGSPLAWSPDGGQIAFYEGEYPFQRINVINLDGTNRRVLTPEPDFQIYHSHLVWSPDGGTIAFYQPSNPPDSNQEIIKTVDLSSGTIATLTRPGFYNALSWSPDSRYLAFTSGSQFERQTMFVYDLASGDFTVLTPDPFQNVLTSAWSPDGNWIAFTATPIGDELGTQILYTVRADGSGLAALTSPDEYVYPFAWIPQP
jgi:Tol biopolymer transport system component